ncbi:MAG: hypothetical protein JW753_02940 [Dehalococcoidia bacterium]|nr:hypothetical protein [Dehalococcoidia bacterium]
MLGIGLPYLLAFVINFLLLFTLFALLAGLAAFLIIRAVRKKRAPCSS